MDKPVNEAPININTVKNYGDSLESVDSSVQINVGCAEKTSIDTYNGRNWEWSSHQCSVSVDLLTTTVTNKNSQEADHVGQLSGEINNLLEDVTTRATVPECN